MNILRKIIGVPADRLETRLQNLVGERDSVPVWQKYMARQVNHPEVELFRDARGVLRHVRIGPWRIIAASKTRRIAEVRDLACKRVAVRIEREDPEHRIPRSTNWELYDLEGHLLAMLQNVPGQNLWLATDFEVPEPGPPVSISHPSASAAGGLPVPGLLPCSG